MLYGNILLTRLYFTQNIQNDEEKQKKTSFYFSRCIVFGLFISRFFQFYVYFIEKDAEF